MNPISSCPITLMIGYLLELRLLLNLPVIICLLLQNLSSADIQSSEVVRHDEIGIISNVEANYNICYLNFELIQLAFKIAVGVRSFKYTIHSSDRMKSKLWPKVCGYVICTM